jgi:exosortase
MSTRLKLAGVVLEDRIAPDPLGPSRAKHATARNAAFAACVIVSMIAGWATLTSLIGSALEDEREGYLFLVPFISAMLFIRAGKTIADCSRFFLKLGLPIVLVSIALFSFVSWAPSAAKSGYSLTLIMLAIVLFWLGSFLLFYGAAAFRATVVAWCFLALIIPVPTILLDRIASTLQERSADIASMLFRLTGMPAFREGVRFALPGIDIEIAKECSGIRSAIALVLANSLAAQLMLRSYAGRIAVAAFSVPFVICKNAMRIVTISWLGVYVSRGFFYGRLHRNSGIVFSILDVVMLILVISLLRRAETRASHAPNPTQSPAFSKY